MQIGELAKKGGVPVQTVRFYERRGLLPNPPRKESGYRLYSDRELGRLLFIRQAKMLGFSLDEVGEILRMRKQGHCPCGRVLNLAERHLQDVERQLEQLSRFRGELRRAVKQWKLRGEQRLSGDEFCGLIEKTMPIITTKGRGKRTA